MGVGGERYQRWWGEAHHGNRIVQKYGNSSTGEGWDVTEHMDTYYNPIPHFNYDLALAHSPQLRAVVRNLLNVVLPQIVSCLQGVRY